jgi:hypothetical protein
VVQRLGCIINFYNERTACADAAICFIGSSLYVVGFLGVPVAILPHTTPHLAEDAIPVKINVAQLLGMIKRPSPLLRW